MKTKFIIFFARVTIGWLFFYAGVTKIFDPSWSAAGYLNAAKNFTGFYHWLATPTMLPFINFINAWGLTLVGLALILGFWVRLSAYIGVAFMVLYYLPILDFPYPNAHSFLVDEHVIYVAVLLLLSSLHAGRVWGLDSKYGNKVLS